MSAGDGGGKPGLRSLRTWQPSETRRKRGVTPAKGGVKSTVGRGSTCVEALGCRAPGFHGKGRGLVLGGRPGKEGEGLWGWGEAGHCPLSPWASLCSALLPAWVPPLPPLCPVCPPEAVLLLFLPFIRQDPNRQCWWPELSVTRLRFLRTFFA